MHIHPLQCVCGGAEGSKKATGQGFLCIILLFLTLFSVKVGIYEHAAKMRSLVSPKGQHLCMKSICIAVQELLQIVRSVPEVRQNVLGTKDAKMTR